MFQNPTDIVTAYHVDEVLSALGRVEEATSAGKWAAGFVAYEAAPAFDAVLQVKDSGDVPLVWFGIFDGPGSTEAPPEGFDERPTADHSSGLIEGSNLPGFRLGPWEPDVEPSEYDRAIHLIRAAIGEGATYQVNYTLRMRASFRGQARALYDRLRAAQGPAYAAFLDLGRFQILSASPELFFSRSGNQVMCRPMKGTARRGRWAEEDDAARDQLLASEKERAENAMIVDLIRNDLGRISEYGTVRASRVFEVEQYRTVHQMTSTVEGTARPDTSLTDLFSSLFPCGSVTGAPKIATTGFIADLEREPRGVYCGAIGYVEPTGDCVFNVPIRTAVVDVNREVVEYGVGGGITWDSNPEGEYAEMLAKAEILRVEWPDFSLLETLRGDPDGPVRMDGHIERMGASADYFGYSFEPSRARGAITEAWEQAHSGRRGFCRIRVLADAVGEISVEVRPLDEAERNPIAARAAWASSPVDSTNVFLFHKTTNREVYESRTAEYPGLFDVLLVNEDGYVTEFTRGNAAAEIDGVVWTPPRECGLLSGVFRDELLAGGDLYERRLTPVDMTSASRVWLINSVREWVEIELVGSAPGSS